MPKTRKLQLAFSGGEIDTQMYGRIDSPQYQSGLATCKNWIVDPRGSLRRRPGMQRVASTLDSTQQTRLIPFTYSVDQQLAVELSNEKARFHTGGGTVVWAAFKEFSRDDIAANKITFLSEHGLLDDEPIVFYARATTGVGTPRLALPAPFTNPDNNYHVSVVDSRTIQVLDAAGGNVVPITSLGSTGFRFFVFKRGTQEGYVGPARVFKTWSRDISSTASSLWRAQSGSQFCIQFTDGTTPPGTNKFHQGERVELVYEASPNVAVRLPGIPHPLWVDYFGSSGASCTNQRFGLRTKEEYVGTETSLAPDTWVDDAEIRAASNLPGASGNNIFIRQYHQKGDLIWATDQSFIPAQSQYRVFRVSEDFGSPWNDDWAGDVALNTTELEDDGTFSIPTPFQESELFDIEYDQSGDVVTLTHPSHPPQELRRYANTNWDISAIEFDPLLSAPVLGSPIINRGQAYSVTHDGTSAANTLDFSGGIVAPFAIGDNIYLRNQGNLASGYYTVGNVVPDTGSPSVGIIGIKLLSSSGTEVTVDTSSNNLASAFVYYSVSTADPDETYVVTAVDQRGQESFGSEELLFADNVLASPGASNTVSWTSVPGAKSYNVYKKFNGTFGFIGQVDFEEGAVSYSFEDDNIGPDLSQTLLIKDGEVDASFQPRASARFEQRRCFGGSDALPRTLFMSRTGTESSFSYRFPVQPDDRISVDLASREAHVIRHIVPVQDLLMMTQQGEFRVTAINSDAITPNTIAIRQQSYIGSNSVHPQVVNNSVVFCSARGGHARELNFRVESQGYLTGDLSLRAAHLFDGFTLNDLAYSKAPVPVLWFVSSSGKLLCLTYIPEERVLAWHQHETDGAVESVCSISEGDYDNLYVVVKRGDDRSVERIVQVREEALEDAVYLDASVSYDGTNTDTNAQFEVFSTGLYKAGDTVTVTAYDSDPTGPFTRKGLFSSEDEGDVLEFTSGGQKYRLKFETDVGNQTYFTGKLLTDWPDALKNTKTTAWAWARKTFSGYSHLASESVTVLADGVTQETLTVNSSGEITLTDYAVKVCAGLAYTSQAKTLPMSLEIEAGAQGRTKSVNQVFVRVEDTGALQVGMDEAGTKPVSELSNTELKTGEFRTSVPSTWDEEGQIVVEATGAAPANLLNITAQVSIGD